MITWVRPAGKGWGELFGSCIPGLPVAPVFPKKPVTPRKT